MAQERLRQGEYWQKHRLVSLSKDTIIVLAGLKKLHGYRNFDEVVSLHLLRRLIQTPPNHSTQTPEKTEVTSNEGTPTRA